GPRRSVIYLDSSVALAHLLAEDRFPAEDLWRQRLVSSRLLEYECSPARSVAWRCSTSANRQCGAARAGGTGAGACVGPVSDSVRPLDALHLASIKFLRQRQQQVELASYDERLIAGARASYFAVWCRNHPAEIDHGVERRGSVSAARSP